MAGCQNGSGIERPRSRPPPFSIRLLKHHGGRDAGGSQLDDHQLWLLLTATYCTKSDDLVAPNRHVIVCIKTELDLHRLTRVSGWLWVAGRLVPPRPLHHHLLLNRDVFVTEQMDMHLVWTTGRIFVKPIPRFLLEPCFWTEYLCCGQGCGCSNGEVHPRGSVQECERRKLWKCAIGFLFSYTALIRHESDFLLAKEKHLLPEEVKWPDWMSFVEQLDTEHIYQDIHPRFYRGELRLSRLNKIYRLYQTPLRRYMAHWGQYATFFRDNFAWLARTTVYIAVVTPKGRNRVRPDGPWQVQAMSTLPLKAISRLWGKFNELTIPYYLRVPCFKLYSWAFGVKFLTQISFPDGSILIAYRLDEVAEPDLHVYPNLASFFYRTLKPGARPLDPDPHTLLCPSDGKVLQFGQIEGGDIEQVKGMTYSIDALLGKNTPTPSISSGSSSKSDHVTELAGDEELVKQDEEFAQVNGISYTLPDLLSGAGNRAPPAEDQSMPASPGTPSALRAELAVGERSWYDLLAPDKTTSLYYAVIYLAPGDYHRFHSPTNWVVDRRRHFPGELYSVSPYLQRTLPGLFTLNERVVLLGRWRWGFFSYVPVGATNVGSIAVNFDRELRTNSRLTDTAAYQAVEDATKGGEPYQGFVEATYEASSPVLRGHALRRGEEMGGFQLGSTIVLVFEAPAEKTGENNERLGWAWAVEKGQSIKMGQALGRVIE